MCKESFENVQANLLKKYPVGNINSQLVVSHIAKSVICRIWVILQQLCSHSTFVWQIFLCVLLRCDVTASWLWAKHQEKIKFCQTNVWAKLLKNWASEYFPFSDNTYFKTTDILMLNCFRLRILINVELDFHITIYTIDMLYLLLCPIYH